MPVLARAVETIGIPAVIVTMLPEMAERFDLSRIVGVEFPFGHAFGMPADHAMQLSVAKTALSLYERADLPVREDVPIAWPVDWKTAYREWQPKEPSPIIAHMKNQVLARHGKPPPSS